MPQLNSAPQSGVRRGCPRSNALSERWGSTSRGVVKCARRSTRVPRQRNVALKEQESSTSVSARSSAPRCTECNSVLQCYCPSCKTRTRWQVDAPQPRKRSPDPTALSAMPEPSDGDVWLTTEQVAVRLGIQPSSLTSMTSRAEFPKRDYHWRRRNYWLRSTVNQWFAAKRTVRVELLAAHITPAQVSEGRQRAADTGRFLPRVPIAPDLNNSSG